MPGRRWPASCFSCSTGSGGSRPLRPGPRPGATSEHSCSALSILWGGLFFAQFLVIWYGNIPEEVGFIANVSAAAPTRELCASFLAAGFAVPFLGLLSARAKRSPRILGAISLTVLLGLLAEKLVFILPAVALNFGVLLMENALLLTVWLLAVQSRGRLLPGAGEEEAA